MGDFWIVGVLRNLYIHESAFLLYVNETRPDGPSQEEKGSSQNLREPNALFPKLSPPLPPPPPVIRSRYLSSASRDAMAALLGRRFGMAAAALIALAALGSAASGTASKSSFVKSTVKAHDVVIFSKSYCPYGPPSPIYPLCIPLYCSRLAFAENFDLGFGM